MTTLPNLQKGITKDATPPATDTVVSPITIPNGTILITTKPYNEIIDNLDQLIDYVSGDNGPNFIPQSAIADLVTDLAEKEPTLGFTPEDLANKGANSGYAALDGTSQLLLANYPTGSALQILRRNDTNNLLEFADNGIFLDTVFKIQASTDPTRQFRFFANNISAGTTRIIEIPDSDGTILVTPIIQDLDMNENIIVDVPEIILDTPDNMLIRKNGNSLEFKNILAFARFQFSFSTGFEYVFDSNSLNMFGNILKNPSKITDSQDDTLLDFIGISNAVNHIRITNSISDSGPIISTAGSSNDISLSLQVKGDGVIFINSNSISLGKTNTVNLDLSNQTDTVALTLPDLAGVDDVLVTELATQVLSNKTLTTPVIGNFTNSQHNHQNAAGGSQLNALNALNATGTKDGTTFLRGDNTWAVPPGGGGGEFFGPWTNTHDAGAQQLADLGSLSSNSVNPASLGFVRLAESDTIQWRNVANTDNNQISFSGDLFQILPNGILAYSFNSDELDMKGHDILNVDNILLTSSTNVKIGVTGSDLQFDTGTLGGARITYTIDGNIEFLIRLTGIDLKGNHIRDVSEIIDVNSNILLDFEVESNAVNFMRIRNSAADEDPIISAVGASDDIGLQFRTKGGANITLFSDTVTFGRSPTVIFGVGFQNSQVSLSIPNLDGTDDILVTELVTQTLTNKTLDNPIISNFTNAQHNHLNPAGGGLLSSAVLNDVADLAKVTQSNGWGAFDQNIATGGKFQEAGKNISPIGKHDIWFDAGGIVPVDTGSLSTRIVGTGIFEKAITFIPYANGIDSFAVIKFKLPRTWNSGTITAIINWTTEASGSGAVLWGISGAALGNDDNMANIGFGTEITILDNTTGFNQTRNSNRTAVMTFSNSPVGQALDTLFLKIRRIGSDGTDTFANSAQLLGISIEITTDEAVSP